MIGDWLAQPAALAAAVGVVFGPGLLLGFLLRLRGLALWATAPIASTALLSLLAIVLGFAGVAWTPLSIAGGVVIGAVLCLVLRLVLRPVAPVAASTAVRSRALLPAGLGVGVVVGALRFGFYVGDPSAISQTNDAVFHLNAIRWILETGSASSFDVSGVIGGTGFYPAAWHALVSAVVVLSGAEIAIAANMVSLVVAVLVWPLGIAWMTRIAVGASWPTAPAIAAALSPALLAFPMLMFEWGVLYPYALSVALLPAAVAIVVAAPAAFARGGDGLWDRVRSGALLAVLVLASATAIALSQPAVLLAWGLLAVIWFTWWAASRLRAGRRAVRAILAVSLAVAWVGFGALWYVLAASTNGSHWPPFRSKLGAVADVLLNGPVGLPFAVGVSILALIGLVVAVRTPRLRWLATSWLALAGLYAVTAAIANPLARRWLLGAWYADPYRLAALGPVVLVPLAAIGLAAVGAWAAMAISGRGRAVAERSAAVAGIAVIAVVGIVGLAVAPVVQMPKVIEGTRDSTSRYDSGPESFLSPDERELLERLDEHVPEDALIIGNPSTGSGFAYVVGDRDVYPRTWSPPGTEDWAVLAGGLRDAADDPAVCPAWEALGRPAFVLDFGPGEASPGRYIMPGFTGFASQEGFELVDEVGEASLWRITACD